MKLLRVGKKEKEIPALVDKDNNFRDLSRIIDDLNVNNFDKLEKDDIRYLLCNKM